MKLFIDDIRQAPDSGWALTRTITEAIAFIARYGKEIDEISIDHDISFDVRVENTYRPFPSPDTFKAVAYFIGEYYSSIKPQTGFQPKIIVHSANPLGCEGIKNLLEESYGLDCEIRQMGEATRNNKWLLRG